MAESQAQGQSEQKEEGSSLFSKLRYFLLIYLVFNTVTGFLNNNKENKPIDLSSQLNKDDGNDGSGIKLTPNLRNSSFIVIEKPEQEYKLIDLTDKDGLVIGEKKIKTIEQIVYENSLKEAKILYPFTNSSIINLSFYINEFENIEENQVGEPIWEINNVSIDSKNSQTKNFQLKVPNDVQNNNGSLYLHTFISQNEIEGIVGYKSFQLNTFFPKKKQPKLHKLIGTADDQVEASIQEVEEEEISTEIQPIVAYWHPNVTIAITKSPGLIDTAQLPPPLSDIFPLDPLNRRDNLTGLVTQYFPPIFQNKFWQLKDHMYEINSTVDELDFNLSIDYAGFWKIQALALFSDGLQQQQQNPLSGGLTDGSELDGIKKILLDTNPYLLAITIAVSLLHSLLEFLAFKNDISHWRNKKNNVGISVPSIVANVVQQLITLLYLIDSSENTSFMILASQGFGILVEAWKITTIVKIDVQWIGIIPKITITDKYELSETEEKTKEYDSIAFKYLYWVAVPLLASYAVYSLIYKEHKSWYSFIVTTLVGFVYTYGFLTLVPSVYINYRLKSVAHVPKKAMAYKVVNTFIDDLFAFVIKMPWLHKLATLRDDVIFFIFLYQSWIYRVDYSRVNEYGQVGDDDKEADVKDVEGDEKLLKEKKKEK